MPSTNTRLDLAEADSDHEDGVAKKADPKGPVNAATRPAPNRTTSLYSRASVDEINFGLAETSYSSSRNGSHSVQAGLLQIPSESGPSRQPLETAVWDWDAPLETVGEPSSYYYEPQGELLKEQRQPLPASKEFNIPQAVSASGLDWFTGLVGNDGFTIPGRPSGKPPSVAGSKRKSVADADSGSTGNQPEQKRFSRMMSDSDEAMSPVEVRSGVHLARSQSGPAGRPRGATESTQERGGLSTTETEGPRRTFEDPSVPMVLPPRKVFPIQIGDKLFRLSGASISSDGEQK